MTTNPFSKIAIALSGGGYRATAFHLGMLSLLDYLPNPNDKDKSLLDNVRMISTISGGTFTGVMWLYYKSCGNGFDACFHKLYQVFQEDKLLDMVFDKLNNHKGWDNELKSHNLINAFAEIYSNYLFDKASLNCFHNTKHQASFPIFSFNATEFQHGLAFRFKNEGKFGNNYIHLPYEDTEEIKLGDIVAASSCFPGGFEPISFPGDFIQSKDGKLAKAWSKTRDKDGNQVETVSLMDGGILDNQGIEPLELIIKRLEKEQKTQLIDTLIVSDVDSGAIQPFEQPEQKRNSSIFTIKRVKQLLLVLFFFNSIVFFSSLWFVYSQSSVSWMATMVGTLIVGLFSGIAYYLINQLVEVVTHTSNKLFQRESKSHFLNLDIIHNTPLPILRNLIVLRVTSSLKLMTDIFMRRIRRMQYDILYKSPDWKSRIIGNFIYSLIDHKKVKKHYNIELSEECQKIIKQAARMPTTLWFGEKLKSEGMIDALIISGQITTCYKLMDFLRKRKEEFNENPAQKSLHDIADGYQKPLLELFTKLNNNPRFLLDKYLETKIVA